jgi:dipeptidyl aminopeptidase/acylaminoacyl peptidase
VVAEFLRAAPDAIPETYAAASPLAQLPSPAEVLVVHGADDARVPIEHTRAYVAAARAAGSTTELLELAELSHLADIAPDAPHWDTVHAWLDRWRGSQ